MYAFRTSNDSKIFTEGSSQTKIKWIASRVGYHSTSFLDNELAWGVVLEFFNDKQQSDLGFRLPRFFLYTLYQLASSSKYRHHSWSVPERRTWLDCPFEWVGG